MPTDHRVDVISPYAINAPGDAGPFPFDLYERKCLAQGDSWFSIGAIPPTLTSNVLAELWLDKSTVIVNCARPAKLLAHMADTSTEPMFLRALSGNLAEHWDAILFSGVGNDVIDAAQLPPANAPEHRLLKTPAEIGVGAASAADYLSGAGWATLTDHIEVVFNALVDARDSTPVNRGCPMLFHNYARLQPRNAPAGASFGPWLFKAFTAFAIPGADWLALSDELMQRCNRLLQDLIAPRASADPSCNLHLVDTQSANLVLSLPGSQGASNDYANEIHPTRGGYRKLAGVWRQSIEGLPGW